MTRFFIAYHKFDLELVVKVTLIREKFHIWNLEGVIFGFGGNLS